MSAFDGLHPDVRAALAKLGIDQPTRAQSAMIPAVTAGKSVLLVAPTGIGKTEAAMLPLLDRLVREQPPGIHVLYITPLRALNRDMLRRMEFFGQALGLTVGVRHGDTPQGERLKQARKPPQIMITTPETLQIMFTGKKLRDALANVKVVVVDEIHELAGDERGAQLSVGLERLADIAGEFQRIGLSATVGSPQDVASFLGGSGRKVIVVKAQMPKGLEISVVYPKAGKEDKSLADIIQTEPEMAAAMRVCRKMVEGHRSTLFFVNTRDTAEYLASRYHVWDEKFKIGVHHGSLSKHVRVEMEEDFKAERLKALICTSSLELGIDVGSTDYAVQFGSPREVARLVQRVGRAGHGVGRTSEGLVVAQGVDDAAEAAVIARRALAGEIEEVPIRKNPMTVLANQIVAHAMTHATGDPEALFAAVRRTWVFRDLARTDFDRVAAFLGDVRTIAIRDGNIRKSARTIEHYFENISMIPDEKTYRIIDITTRRHVGQLDEAFVASFSDHRMPFIVKGNPWRIVDIEGDQILVEPVTQVGVVPSWVGEEIPVPFGVALEVGALRRKRDYGSYPADSDCVGAISDKLTEQDAKKLALADDSTIIVETDGGLMVVNACFGTKVNETLGRLLASLMAARSGESVGMRVDPYRIVLEFPWKADAAGAMAILRDTQPEALGPLVRLAVRRSLTFKWRFVQAAKKFGVVSRDADYRTMNLDSLVEAYDGSPLVEEALERSVWDEMDLTRATDVLRKIKSGEIKLAEGRLSPMGILGIEESGELVAPSRPSKAILDALRKRLEEEEVRILCLNCRKSWRSRAGRLPEKLRCMYCGAVQVAALGSREADKAKLFSKPSLTAEERKEVKRIAKNADLVREHGRRAALVLCGRGIGPDAAARILQKYRATDDDLLALVLAAEVQFAKTKRFWD